jgi:FkbM family methyltransferase
MSLRSLRSIVRRGIEKLPNRFLYEVFYQSGRALGITGYEVTGDFGPFIGPLYDQSILKPYLEYHTWSPVIVKHFLDFFEKHGKGSFYDLGANIGLVTSPIAQNRHVKCICFEPDPDNFSFLVANISRNCRFGNVTTVNAAVSDNHGQLRFEKSEYNSGDHHISKSGSIIVKTVKLDEYLSENMPIGVKIDCQGAEPLIILGGTQTLARADLIVCEFWPWGIRRMGLSPESILKFVETSNFPYVRVLRHNEPVGTPLCVQDGIRALQKLIDDGNVYTEADLILERE